MRLVATEYLTLDGIFEEPGQWSFPFFNEEAQQFKFDELRASDRCCSGARPMRVSRPRGRPCRTPESSARR